MDAEPISPVPPAPSPRPSENNPNTSPRRSSIASELVENAAAESDKKKVRCVKFRQQELWAWKPVWSPKIVVSMYLLIAVIFIPLGIVILIQSSRLSSTTRARYDNVSPCNVGNQTLNGESRTCVIRFNITRDMTAPAYFYYGLVNFYQNARLYAKSRSDQQLRGDENPDFTGCDGLETDASGNSVVPCGLVAESRFNDTFELCRDVSCNDPVNVTSKEISWDIDRSRRFKGSDSFTDEQNALIRSEEFMVWMRLAAYRNWKKLYRVINENLPAGDYFVRIKAQYPVESFDGEKFFFISETSWFGGPNRFLGFAYIVVGGIALLLAIIFLLGSRKTTTLELPPETTVALDGLVKNPFIPGAQATYNDDNPNA